MRNSFSGAGSAPSRGSASGRRGMQFLSSIPAVLDTHGILTAPTAGGGAATHHASGDEGVPGPRLQRRDAGRDRGRGGLLEGRGLLELRRQGRALPGARGRGDRPPLREARPPRRFALLSAALEDPGAGADAAGRSMTKALTSHQDLHVLFSEFRVHAARNPSTRRKLAKRRAEIRATLAETVEGYAKRAGAELTMPAEDIATLLLALSNGLALERLGQPEAVPDELFGGVIEQLFRTP